MRCNVSAVCFDARGDAKFVTNNVIKNNNDTNNMIKRQGGLCKAFRHVQILFVQGKNEFQFAWYWLAEGEQTLLANSKPAWYKGYKLYLPWTNKVSTCRKASLQLLTFLLY